MLQEENYMSENEIQAMLKLIPNGVVIDLEDLNEIFSQEEKK